MNGSASSLPVMLSALGLPAMRDQYEALAGRAAQENSGYEQYLGTLCETELANRQQRRLARLLRESHLPEGKSLETLEWSALPLRVRRQLPVLQDGGFVRRAENVLVFGLPGRGKTHLVCAIARHLLLSQGVRVWFSTAFHLVQQLLAAKQQLRIEELLRKLDRYEVVILDDIGYVQQNREEMEVLFSFLAERYERRSLMLTSNLVFSQWDRIFKDPMTTAAAIDRLVHHSMIVELDGESYRTRQAMDRHKAGVTGAGAAAPVPLSPQGDGNSNGNNKNNDNKNDNNNKNKNNDNYNDNNKNRREP